MNNLFVEASPSTPEVNFRFDSNTLSLKGESYPENAAAYWGRILGSLQEYLAKKVDGAPIVLNVALTYFNSSSTKMLFSLFEMLNEKAETGTPVILNWHYDEEDETIFEFGQELQEDFTAITFHNHAVSG